MPKNKIMELKESEIIGQMIQEAQHEIVKARVMERFFMLMALKGSAGKNKDAEYQYQGKRRAAEASIPTLEGMYKDAIEREKAAEPAIPTALLDKPPKKGKVEL